MSDDEQQELIPITHQRLINRGYVPYVDYVHSDNPNWWVCDALLWRDGTMPVRWHRDPRGENVLYYMHELEAKERMTPKQVEE